MSLVDKIENLQKKPESVRRRVLFFSVMVTMFLIITIWVSTLKISSKDDQKVEASYTPVDIFNNLVKDSLSVPVAGVKEAFGQFKKAYGSE